MSKKKLNTAGVLNELTGKSRFFERPKRPPAEKINPKKIAPTPTDKKPDTTIPNNHDTVIPRHHDTVMIEAVRKALKAFGKEAATHRFTLEEKQGIAELIFNFRQKNIRTSENEIARIAINWIMLDYKKNKANSVLHKALVALNS